MTMKWYMLDTNTCTYIIKNYTHDIMQRMDDVVQDGRSRIVISSVTLFELLYGALGTKAQADTCAKIEKFVDNLDDALAVDAQAVRAGVQIQAELTKIGRKIGKRDSLLAGHALTTGSIFVTHNTGEFSRVQGLKIEDWLLLH